MRFPADFRERVGFGIGGEKVGFGGAVERIGPKALKTIAPSPSAAAVLEADEGALHDAGRFAIRRPFGRRSRWSV